MATGSGAGLPPYVSEQQAEKTKGGLSHQQTTIRVLMISFLSGIFVYRNIADLERIMDYAELPHISKASVVGGGLLGLEAAKAVYDMPGVPDVSIIIRQDYPLNRQLDPSAGELVLRKIEAMGVKVLTQVRADRIGQNQNY